MLLFVFFKIFNFFLVFLCKYVCTMQDSMQYHQSKHDQILGTSPKLSSHSLCVSKLKEIPKRKNKCKEKLVYTMERWWSTCLSIRERGRGLVSSVIWESSEVCLRLAGNLLIVGFRVKKSYLGSRGAASVPRCHTPLQLRLYFFDFNARLLCPAASPRSKLDYKLCFDARVPDLAASPRSETVDIFCN